MNPSLNFACALSVIAAAAFGSVSALACPGFGVVPLATLVDGKEQVVAYLDRIDGTVSIQRAFAAQGYELNGIYGARSDSPEYISLICKNQSPAERMPSPGPHRRVDTSCRKLMHVQLQSDGSSESYSQLPEWSRVKYNNLRVTISRGYSMSSEGFSFTIDRAIDLSIGQPVARGACGDASVLGDPPSKTPVPGPTPVNP